MKTSQTVSRSIPTSLVILAAALALQISGRAAPTNWIAFNDYVPGTTAPFVNTYNLRGTGTSAGQPPEPTSGILTNFLDTETYFAGDAVGAMIVVTAQGSPDYFGSTSYPNADTPAYNLFNGIVDVGNQNSAIGIRASTPTTVTITFTNLDPSMRYVFRGTAVRGNNYVRRWTVATLRGATSFTDAHTSGIYTRANFASGGLTNGQAAWNSGENREGELVGWDNINPGPDGSFSIFQAQWTASPLPNGQTPDLGAYGYAFNALMLAEVGEPTPIVITAQPAANTQVEELRPFTLSVRATGTRPAFQWYHDDIPIDGATSPTYSVANAAPADTGDYYVVIVGTLSTEMSTVAHVSVESDLQPPGFISAQGSSTLDTVYLAFAEPLNNDPAGPMLDPANWSVTDNTGGGVQVQAVALADGDTTLILTTDIQADDTLYTVGSQVISDVKGNLLSTNVQFQSWLSSSCGGLRFEVYTMQRELDTGTTDNNITNVLYDINFLKNNPREIYLLAGFDTRSAYADDTHEHYGGRAYGLFIPPRTGNWRFYISSDDSSQLYFNASGPTAAGKVKVAEQTGCCNAFGDDTPGGLASAAFPLVAGKAYYIEGIFKEGTGGDYLQVAAGLQGDPVPTTPIPASWVGYGGAPAGIGGTLQITKQPANLAVIENTMATFSVDIKTTTGAPVCYQWRANDVDIVGAEGPTYSFLPTTAEDGTVFTVQASIMGGATVLSQPATLRVSSDTEGPTVASVVGPAGGTNVIVTFSEDVEPTTAADAAFYLIDDLPVIEVILLAPNSVWLTPSMPITACENHTLTVFEVTDLVFNPIRPNPAILTFTPEAALVLAAPGDDLNWQFDQSGVDLGTTWVAINYDDSAWEAGPQLFDAKSVGRDTLPNGMVVATKLNLYNANYPGSDNPTYYFRTHVNIPVAISKVTNLRLRHVIDDGLVLYLNGKYVYNTASSVVGASFATYFPGSAVGDADWSGVIDLPVTNLVRGDNVIAAEVKQVNSTSTDITFGLELIANVTDCGAEEAATLAYARTDTGLILSWSASGYLLERATALTGPWTPVTGAVSPYPVKPTAPVTFYRLKK